MLNDRGTHGAVHKEVFFKRVGRPSYLSCGGLQTRRNRNAETGRLVTSFRFPLRSPSRSRLSFPRPVPSLSFLRSVPHPVPRLSFSPAPFPRVCNPRVLNMRIFNPIKTYSFFVGRLRNAGTVIKEVFFKRVWRPSYLNRGGLQTRRNERTPERKHETKERRNENTKRKRRNEHTKRKNAGTGTRNEEALKRGKRKHGRAHKTKLP